MMILREWWDKAYKDGLSEDAIDVLSDWEKAEAAAQKLCQIYFEIAEECIGEAEVCRQRDERIKAFGAGKSPLRATTDSESTCRCGQYMRREGKP